MAAIYVNSNCLIWHDPYMHRIKSVNKSLVQMEPFQFTPAVLEEDSEAVQILQANHYINTRLYCNPTEAFLRAAAVGTTPSSPLQR